MPCGPSQRTIVSLLGSMDLIWPRTRMVLPSFSRACVFKYVTDWGLLAHPSRQKHTSAAPNTLAVLRDIVLLQREIGCLRNAAPSSLRRISCQFPVVSCQ